QLRSASYATPLQRPHSPYSPAVTRWEEAGPALCTLSTPLIARSVLSSIHLSLSLCHPPSYSACLSAACVCVSLFLFLSLSLSLSLSSFSLPLPFHSPLSVYLSCGAWC